MPTVTKSEKDAVDALLALARQNVFAKPSTTKGKARKPTNRKAASAPPGPKPNPVAKPLGKKCGRPRKACEECRRKKVGCTCSEMQTPRSLVDVYRGSKGGLLKLSL